MTSEMSYDIAYNLPRFGHAESSMLPAGRRRAQTMWGPPYGHAAYGTWGQQMEAMGCGTTSFGRCGGCDPTMGGYEGKLQRTGVK